MTPDTLGRGQAGVIPTQAPIAADERLAAVDTLRGFAVFGILLVNMAFFARPLQEFMLPRDVNPAIFDRLAEWLILILAESKFYTLFSFLFGLGMAIQMQRVMARGGGFGWLYVRRLLVLLGIGLCHALFLWYGDVLTMYAVLGFPLLLFRRRSARLVLICAVLIYALPVLFFGGCTVLCTMVEACPEIAPQGEQSLDEWYEQTVAAKALAFERYSEGGIVDAFRQRLADHRDIVVWTILAMAPQVFTMFLLGLMVGRWRILHDPTPHLTLLRTLAAVGLTFGLLCNVAYTLLIELAGRESMTPQYFAGYAIEWLGVPPLSFGYAAVIVLLVRSQRWGRWLSPLAAVGRMALTNYLLQTLVCTTLFYGYGFGLFGKVGPAWGLLLSVVIYAAQIPLSVWWLRNFRFGPAEWLWRSLTYMRLQPMRLPPPGGLPPPTQGLI